MPPGREPRDVPTVVQMAGGRTSRHGKDQGGSGEFQFGTGSLCLDFIATIELRGRPHPELGLLATTERLGDWLNGPGLPVPAGGLTEEDLVAADKLRTAIDGVARAIIAGRLAEPADVRRINSFAQHPTPVFLLRAGGREQTLVEEADLGSVLSVIARDAVHLLTSPDTSRLRECAREGCSTLFFDRSPSGRRRWCSMKGCGEMVASASYRRRHMAKVSQ